MERKQKIIGNIVCALIVLGVIVAFYDLLAPRFFHKQQEKVITLEQSEEEKQASHIELVEQILKYNKIVAYKECGRWYDDELPITTELEFDVDLDSYEGIDGLGFVDWCFRFITGRTLDNIEFLFTFFEENEKVTDINKLQIGDIGVNNMESEIRNIFGVYIGTYQGVPVFATCRYSPFGKMQWGGLQVAYLKSERDEVLDGAEPVELNYFIRPGVEWVDEKYNLELVMGQNGLKVKENAE